MWTRLFWKDWRVNRIVVAGSAILIACPYAATALLEYFYARPAVNITTSLRTSLATAAMMALVVTALMAAVFGGVAFAAERRDRSAEFLAMLPVSRRKVVLVKLLFAGACVAAMWLLNLLVILALGGRPERWGALYVFGPVTLMAFGVAWLCSTRLTSPGVAAAISIGVTIFSTWGLAALISTAAGAVNAGVVKATVLTWAVGTGLLCLLVGSVNYLRRVEP